MSTLIIESPTQHRWRFDEPFVVRFGRKADLELPLLDPATMKPHPSMGRHVGTLLTADGEVRLHHQATPDGRKRSLWLRRIGAEPVQVPAGGYVVVDGTGTISFSPRDYMLRYSIPRDSPPSSPTGQSGDLTEAPVRLSPREVDFLVALAEPELRASPLMLRRPISEIAALWHVTAGYVNESLRAVRGKLVAADLLPQGVNGLPGVNDIVARVVVDEGLIGREDLDWANFGGQPRPAGTRGRCRNPRFAL